MKKFTITLLLISGTLLSFSQNCQWAQREGGAGGDYGNDIVSDADGNTFSVGQFQGSAVTGCNTLSSSGSFDIFIQKRDRHGNCLWAISEGSSGDDAGRGVAFDTSGFIYVTGYFSGTVLFPTDTLVSNGFTDMFLAKYDTSGTCIWARHLGGVSQTLFWGEYGEKVVVDKDGNPLVVAHTNFKAAIYKYDSNGNHIWNTEVAGNGTIFGTGIDTDSDANVYISLYNHSGTLTYFDCDTIAANANITPHVAKYDMNGNCLWAQQLGVNNTVITGRAHDIAIDNDNMVYIVGGVQLDTDFGCGLTLTNGGLDAFIKKINGNGDCIWSERAGGSNHEQAHGISIMDSIIQITGYFKGAASYFPNDTLTAVGSFDSGYIAEWDTAGNGHWANEAGNGNNHCQMRRISTDQYGNAYITGWALANPVTFQCASLTGAGYDATFARYSPPCQKPTALFQADSVCFGNATSFTDESEPGNAPLVSWGWDFDGDTVADANGSTTSFTFSSSGSHDVILLIENDCGDRDTLEKTVVVHALPNVNLGPDTSACDGDIITLDAGNFASYLWEDNTTNQTLDVTSNDTTWVVVVDTNGCQNIDSIVVMFNPLPQPNLGVDTSICDDETLTLDPGTFNGYLWQDATTGSTYLVDGNTLGAGTYQFIVTVTDANGCENSDSISVEVEVCTGTNEFDDAHSIKAFPNPFHNRLEVVVGVVQNGYVVLQNTLGQQLMRAPLNNGRAILLPDNLAPGHYTLIVKSQYDTTKAVKKLIAR